MWVCWYDVSVMTLFSSLPAMVNLPSPLQGLRYFSGHNIKTHCARRLIWQLSVSLRLAELVMEAGYGMYTPKTTSNPQVFSHCNLAWRQPSF